MNELPIEPEHKFEYMTCPACGMNRKVEKTGRYAERREAKGLRKPLGSKEPGRIRFDAMDLDNALILQIRDARDRLKVISGKTLRELKEDDSFAGIVDQMKRQCEKILRILGT